MNTNTKKAKQLSIRLGDDNTLTAAKIAKNHGLTASAVIRLAVAAGLPLIKSQLAGK